MKNSNIISLFMLLVHFTPMNASRTPDFDDTYLFQSIEHIEKRLTNIGLAERGQNTNIVNDLSRAQTPLDIAFAIEDACDWQIFSVNEAISRHAIKNILYEEFFQDYGKELKLLRKSAQQGYINIHIPHVTPHQK